MQLCSKPRGARGIVPETFRRRGQLLSRPPTTGHRVPPPRAQDNERNNLLPHSPCRWICRYVRVIPRTRNGRLAWTDAIRTNSTIFAHHSMNISVHCTSDSSDCTATTRPVFGCRVLEPHCAARSGHCAYVRVITANWTRLRV